jgi:hypothetical protein
MVRKGRNIGREVAAAWNYQIAKIPFWPLLGSAVAASAASVYRDLSVHGGIGPAGFVAVTLTSSVVLGTLFRMQFPSTRRALTVLQRWAKKSGIGPLIWAFCFGVTYLDSLAVPAMAQATGGGASSGFFFTNIKNKIANFFADSPNAAAVTPIVNFAFGILQVLMIVYIVISIARGIQATQQEEDWKQVARTPLIVVLACVAGDFAVGLI